jgi:hypothetical protein
MGRQDDKAEKDFCLPVEEIDQAFIERLAFG